MKKLIFINSTRTKKSDTILFALLQNYREEQFHIDKVITQLNDLQSTAPMKSEFYKKCEAHLKFLYQWRNDIQDEINRLNEELNGAN